MNRKFWKPISEYLALQCLCGHGSVPIGYQRLVPLSENIGQWIRRTSSGKYYMRPVTYLPGTQSIGNGVAIGSLRKSTMNCRA